MKTPLFLILIFFTKISFATTYYFSSSTGDDNRSVQQAQNSETPWRTLSKLNSFFRNLDAGDVVLLKRGDIFYGSITANVSGKKNQPITISAYGSGAKPVISGLTTLTNWVSLGNGIWESYNPALGTSVNMVLLNNAVQQMGRYPNSDAANKGYLIYESHTNASITDNELSSSINWTGAEVVIRKVFWIMDRNLITSHSGNTLNYISGSGYFPWEDRCGYFIQNDIKTLDQFGEWYYNPSSKKMYVYFGNNSPSNYTIEASTINHLATNAWSVGSIVFNNVTFKGSNSNAINLDNSPYTSINYCDVLFSGVDGIKCVNSLNFKLENSYVGNSNNNGISLEYSNTDALIKNNRIENTHLYAGMGKSGDGQGIGVQIIGNNNRVEYNEVLNTGYSAIFFAGNSVEVKNNFINNHCLNKDDGAGIYTHAGENDPVNTGRKITGNVILNGKGTPEGLADVTAHAHGIYLDGLTTGIEVTGNTMANNSSFGILGTNPSNLLFNNNTLFNNKDQFVLNHIIKNHPVSNNTITNNIFFSKTPDQMTSSLTSIGDDINGYGSFDNNYYARPFEDRMTIYNQYVNASGTIKEVYDLETWKAKYNKDASSKRSPVHFPGFIVNSLIGANKYNNGTFNSNIGEVYSWAALNNIVTSYTPGALDGGSLEVSFNAAAGTPGSSLIILPAGALSSAKKYILKFSLKGSNDNLSLGIFLRQNGGNYYPITATQYSKISSSRTENELLFTVPENYTDADIVFTVDNQNIKFWLDNVQFYEADATVTNPDDYIRFEYNATNVAKTITLDKNYVDVKNNVYSGTITLQPYSSVILMKTTQSSSSLTDNTPPTIVPRNITVNSDNNGKVTIQPNDVIESITDNSGVDQSSIQVSQTQFNCSSVSGSNNVSHQAYIATTTMGTQDFGGELGMEFKVNNAAGITINQLGAFDHQGNGITGTQSGGIRVAIFNKATKTIVPGLDAIIVGNADGYSGNHRMKNIAPVTLMPGDYMVVAKGYNQHELNGNSEGGTPFASGDLAGGAISYAGSSLYGSLANEFTYPSTPDGASSNRYLAGTFSYSTSGSTTNTVSHQAYIATTTTGTQDFGGELGMEFKVNNAAGITINQLGTFDHQGNGIIGTQSGGIRVAIFNKATKTIVPGLDAIIIGNADSYSGNHRMKNIAPVTLMPGDYMVVAKGYNQHELNGNSEGGTPSAFGDFAGGAISYSGFCFYGSTGTNFVYPSIPDGGPNNRYLAGSFSYSTFGSGSTGNNTNTVTITAKDIFGNVAQANATVTVLCNQPNIVQSQSSNFSQGSAMSEESLTSNSENSIKVFPNPTNGAFSVQLPPLTGEQVSIQILNESGKLVTQKIMNLNNSTASLKADFNLSNQAPGIYLVKVISSKGVQISKVVLIK